jgi:uncharacterized protein YcbK (DUF882 family)
MLGKNGRSTAPHDRRGFLRLAAAAGLTIGGSALLSNGALADIPPLPGLKPGFANADLPPIPGLRPDAPELLPMDVRELAFEAMHTGEFLKVPYFENGTYQRDALAEVRHIMRDHRDDREHDIDPGLLDILTALRNLLGTRSPVLIVSAYRSPQTNQMLIQQGSGVAKNSYHLKGQAIDIRMLDRDTQEIHVAALELQAGGVGMYGRSDFVHVDSGPVRTW